MKMKFYMFFIITLLLSITASSCMYKENNVKNATSVMDNLCMPLKKSEGGKFRIAYVDYDAEYLPARQQFYYILEGLRKSGWIICDKFPFSPDTESSKEMIECLSNMDLGPYIEFDKDSFYYLGYEKKRDIKRSLIRHTEVDKDIDLVLTFGTSAGLFVKNLNLSVPMVDFSATDPVASGIIDSATKGSGNDNIWAQVEPSVPMRQMKYYHSLIPFRKLGMIVFGDEVISGIPDVEKASREISFDIVKYNIKEGEYETKSQQKQHYKRIKRLLKKIVREDIDAFLLTVGLINDLRRLENLLDILYQASIPVFVMDDINTVKNGGLLIISAYDYENVGYFVADAIGKILRGANAGDLPCVYISKPYICLNYDIAKRIHFPLKLEFLLSCDKIFQSSK